jgi:hypothetical protein
MKINNIEIKVKTKPAGEKRNHPNILAYASITLKEELGEYITISGFTVWKSIHDGYNVEPPQSNRKFKYLQGTLLPRIKQEIIHKYEYDSKYTDIPIIEDTIVR